MIWFYTTVLFLSCYAAVIHRAFAVKRSNYDISIGLEQGIDSSSSISADTLQRILAGVESGNKENIYFYGILKLYGLSMNKDEQGAAQQFLRASKLGHKQATTAYGTMLLSGALGQPNFVEALAFFRQGVQLGDMVSLFLLIVSY